MDVLKTGLSDVDIDHSNPSEVGISFLVSGLYYPWSSTHLLSICSSMPTGPISDDGVLTAGTFCIDVSLTLASIICHPEPQLRERA